MDLILRRDDGTTLYKFPVILPDQEEIKGNEATDLTIKIDVRIDTNYDEESKRVQSARLGVLFDDEGEETIVDTKFRLEGYLPEIGKDPVEFD